VGGQGMNTGIGDAMNLSWKLAAVLKHRAFPAILNTYETERSAFAKSLVHTTDQVFKLVIGSGPGGELVREALVPHLVPYLMGFSTARDTAFKLISQTRINYAHSELSDGHAGHLRGGDRIPWNTFSNYLDSFTSLKSLDWQIHVYGSASTRLKQTASELHIAVYEFPWSDKLAEDGLKEDAMYLIRPDGYIGLVSASENVEKLHTYLTKFGIKSRASAP